METFEVEFLRTVNDDVKIWDPEVTLKFFETKTIWKIHSN